LDGVQISGCKPGYHGISPLTKEVGKKGRGQGSRGQGREKRLSPCSIGRGWKKIASLSPCSSAPCSNRQ